MNIYIGKLIWNHNE